jgi:hypothetical protein
MTRKYRTFVNVLNKWKESINYLESLQIQTNFHNKLQFDDLNENFGYLFIHQIDKPTITLGKRSHHLYDSLLNDLGSQYSIFKVIEKKKNVILNI